MSHLAKIEALLFVAGEEGLSGAQLAQLVDLSAPALMQQLDKLAEKYQSDTDSALLLVETSRRYRLVTKDEHAELLRHYAKTPTNQSLSRASLEVLSIIAYKQPITRVEVDDIRGVNSSGAIAKLQAFDLIKENGKKEVLGRPNLYVTTDYFMDFMGINSLDELPDVSSIELKDEETSLFRTEESLTSEAEVLEETRTTDETDLVITETSADETESAVEETKEQGN